MIGKLIKVLLTVALLGVALKATAVTPVEQYFQNLKSLRADFVQTVFDDQSQLLQASSGRLHMQRPGRFSWDYTEPFPQMIVSDGERLWLYDSELEQVTVKRLDQALSATPMALLSGAAPIEETFIVGEKTAQNGLDWYQLTPKEQSSDFQALWVGFANEELSAIELHDNFGQRTRLSFERLERDVALDPALFVFIPPPGVDVVGDVP